MAWGPVAAGIAGALGGALINREETRKTRAQNERLQREFAQSGIQWKVADARKAGISPLAALGAGGAQYSPVGAPDHSIGDAVSDMGQNISRAAMASANEQTRKQHQLQLEGLSLDNQIKAAELAKMQQGVGPAGPGSDNFIPGQGNSGLVINKPLERTVSAPGRPAQEAGWRPDVSYARTDTGLTPVVPESLSESLEDDVIGKAMWRWRNQIVPNYTVGKEGKPPDHMLPDPKRQYWIWSYTRQEWQPHTWDKR